MAMPGRGQELLIRLRTWMVRENAVIVAVVCVVVALTLAGDALVSLSS
jgi:hypothetical protein